MMLARNDRLYKESIAEQKKTGHKLDAKKFMQRQKFEMMNPGINDPRVPTSRLSGVTDTPKSDYLLYVPGDEKLNE